MGERGEEVGEKGEGSGGKGGGKWGMPTPPVHPLRLRNLSSLTFTTLRANSTDNNLMIFFQKTGFDISCKLCFLEQIRKVFQNVVC